MKGKNYKSSKTQLFFFTAMPSILVYIGAALIVVGLNENAEMKMLSLPFLVIGIFWSFLGGYVCAANMSLISAIGAPLRTTAKISIGKEKMSASLEMQFSSAQVGQFIINLFFSVLLTIPVALLGCLLHILYRNGKFLSKSKSMMLDCDRADEIIATGRAKIDEVASHFYRMLDYVEVYKRLGERRGANEMIYRAERLLAIWERLEFENERYASSSY